MNENFVQYMCNVWLLLLSMQQLYKKKKTWKTEMGILFYINDQVLVNFGRLIQMYEH